MTTLHSHVTSAEALSLNPSFLIYNRVGSCLTGQSEGPKTQNLGADVAWRPSGGRPVTELSGQVCTR